MNRWVGRGAEICKLRWLVSEEGGAAHPRVHTAYPGVVSSFAPPCSLSQLFRFGGHQAGILDS